MDRFLKMFTKAVMYIGGLLVAMLVVYRGLIPFLWTGGSDLLVIAAIAIALLSVPALLWLAVLAAKSVINTK